MCGIILWEIVSVLGKMMSSYVNITQVVFQILRQLLIMWLCLGSTSGPSGRESRENSIVPEVLETTKEISPPSSPERTSPPRLGPGQVKPRGYRLSSTKPVELKLSLLMTKGQLEVDVVCARHIYTSRESQPDTYVKCYLRDGDRWLQKKKTRVVKHSCEPQFKQTLKYQACDALGRSLVIMLWERQGGFEHNYGLGGAEVQLDLLTLTHPISGWYPLFPIHSLGSDSNDSPWFAYESLFKQGQYKLMRLLFYWAQRAH